MLWSSTSLKSNTTGKDGEYTFGSHSKKKSSLISTVDQQIETISWNSDSSDPHTRIVPLVRLLRLSVGCASLDLSTRKHVE